MVVTPQRWQPRREAAAAKKPVRSFWLEEAGPQCVQRLRQREAVRTRSELILHQSLGGRESLGERKKTPPPSPVTRDGQRGKPGARSQGRGLKEGG